ncbi:MAG: hypothetical protein JWQ71_4528 [Pedosphaera sp.]|nr:hypothetical protein [Pedosphaera sp.]
MNNPMNKSKSSIGMIGFVLCGALLVTQTGCNLPGMHGGPPGLPRPPGLSGIELPNSSGVSLVIISREDLGRNDSPQLAQNEKSYATTTEESHESN